MFINCIQFIQIGKIFVCGTKALNLKFLYVDQWFSTRVPPVQSRGSASLHLNFESSLLLYAYCLKIQ